MEYSRYLYKRKLLFLTGWTTNIGDKKAYLDMAIDMLRKKHCCKVLKIADYITTAPYGAIEQDNFLNSVLRLDTLLTPEELLDEE